MKLARQELQIMEILWRLGPSSVREVLDQFPEDGRPAYTTVQTVLYRLEAKKAARRTKKIGNALIFEPVVTEATAHGRLIEELLGLFSGRAQPLVAHLIDTGKLTLDDVRDAEKRLEALSSKKDQR